MALHQIRREFPSFGLGAAPLETLRMHYQRLNCSPGRSEPSPRKPILTIATGAATAAGARRAADANTAAHSLRQRGPATSTVRSETPSSPRSTPTDAMTARQLPATASAVATATAPAKAVATAAAAAAAPTTAGGGQAGCVNCHGDRCEPAEATLASGDDGVSDGGGIAQGPGDEAATTNPAACVGADGYARDTSAGRVDQRYQGQW